MQNKKEGGTQPAITPSSKATTPSAPLESKKEAVPEIATASQAYVEAACTGASGESSMCESAKILADPDNAAKVEDAIVNTPPADVATINDVVNEQLETPPAADNPPAEAPGGETPIPEETPTPAPAEGENAEAPAKHGMTNQQILGVGLIVWGVLGAVGFGAVTVGKFAQEVRKQRNVTTTEKIVVKMEEKTLPTTLKDSLKILLVEGDLVKVEDWVKKNTGPYKADLTVGQKTALRNYVDECLKANPNMTADNKARLENILKSPQIIDDPIYKGVRERLTAVDIRPPLSSRKLPIREAIKNTVKSGNLKQVKGGLLVTLLGGATAILGGSVYATGGMKLEGETPDPLAVYINTLGDIAVRLQNTPN